MGFQSLEQTDDESPCKRNNNHPQSELELAINHNRSAAQEHFAEENQPDCRTYYNRSQ